MAPTVAETAFATGNVVNVGVVYGDALHDPPHDAAVLSPPAPPPMPVPAMMPARSHASSSCSVWLDTPLAHQMAERSARLVLKGTTTFEVGAQDIEVVPVGEEASKARVSQMLREWVRSAERAVMQQHARSTLRDIMAPYAAESQVLENAVSNLADHAPSTADFAVALDAQWRPDDLHAEEADGNRAPTAALLLLAFPARDGQQARVLLVPLAGLSTNGSGGGGGAGGGGMVPSVGLELRRAVVALLESRAVRKLCYGAREDIDRVQRALDTKLHLRSLLDLQPACHALTRQAEPPALALAVACLLNAALDTGDPLQVSDWQQWPLSAAQMAYAAAEAAVLLPMHAALVMEPLVAVALEQMVEEEEKVVGSGEGKEQGKDGGEVEEDEDEDDEEEDDDIPPLAPVHATAPTTAPTTSVSVYYSAVFLTPASIATLQARYPP